MSHQHVLELLQLTDVEIWKAWHLTTFDGITTGTATGTAGTAGNNEKWKDDVADLYHKRGKTCPSVVYVFDTLQQYKKFYIDDIDPPQKRLTSCDSTVLILLYLLTGHDYGIIKLKSEMIAAGTTAGGVPRKMPFNTSDDLLVFHHSLYGIDHYFIISREGVNQARIYQSYGGTDANYTLREWLDLGHQLSPFQGLLTTENIRGFLPMLQNVKIDETNRQNYMLTLGYHLPDPVLSYKSFRRDTTDNINMRISKLVALARDAEGCADPV